MQKNIEFQRDREETDDNDEGSLIKTEPGKAAGVQCPIFAARMRPFLPAEPHLQRQPWLPEFTQ